MLPAPPEPPDRPAGSGAPSPITPAPDWPLEGPWGYTGFFYQHLTHLFGAYLAGLPLWLVMRLLFQVDVRGRAEVPRLPPGVLLVSNHQSLIDSYFVCLALGLVPYGLLRPRLIPFHTPEERNFMAGRCGRVLHRALRCVPLHRGAGLRQPGLTAIAELLRRGYLAYMFPEGTRTRTGAIGRATPGVGQVILRSGCSVFPVRLWGLDQVLPIHARWPRSGRVVRILAGRVLPPEAFADLPDTSRGWLTAANRALDAVRGLEWPG